MAGLGLLGGFESLNVAVFTPSLYLEPDPKCDLSMGLGPWARAPSLPGLQRFGKRGEPPVPDFTPELQQWEDGPERLTGTGRDSGRGRGAGVRLGLGACLLLPVAADHLCECVLGLL